MPLISLSNYLKILPMFSAASLGDFPFKYLGVPLHFKKKLRREYLQPIIDRIIKNISGWLGRFLSYRGKLILLTTCIASIPVYLMSTMKFPKWAIDMITSQMSHFFWGNMGDNHKYHLANWGLISRRKEFGGMGVPNLREFNMALLASWGRRFYDDRNSDWKKVLTYKYNTTSPNLFSTRVTLGSPFMKSLSWALAASKNFYRWVPGDGKSIAFWHDIWIGDCSLKTAFWDLYTICQQQDSTLAQVWVRGELRLTFRRCV